MQLTELTRRINEGEVVPTETIEDIPVDQYISRNWNFFQNLTVENDLAEGGVMWIYNKEIRENREYNP
jgi:hypothetical protein